ncbi:MAG: tetratricopeptide repeat protein [Kiritimatiellales bacterium]
MNFIDSLRWVATGKVPTRAEKLLRLAEKGNAAAQSELGLCYHEGDEISPNIRESMRWFILAARQGNAQAQYYLGRAYSSGEGVPKDIETAYAWLARSAAQGYKKAAEWKSIIMKEMPPEQIDEGNRLVQEAQTKPIPPRPGFNA